MGDAGAAGAQVEAVLQADGNDYPIERLDLFWIKHRVNFVSEI